MRVADRLLPLRAGLGVQVYVAFGQNLLVPIRVVRKFKIIPT